MDIAILGATGEVGRALLEVLAERRFPVGEIYPLASARSAGGSLTFGERQLEVIDAESFDFSQVQLAFFSAGARLSEHYVPQALAAGVTVVDNTSHFRMQPEVPLIVPEVNGDELAGRDLPLVISCPNCSTIQMVVALSPLAEAFGLEKVEVVTFQSVSGAGHSAVEDLSRHSAQLLSGEEPEAEDDAFDRSVAFNVLPCIGDFDHQGYTGEENKMIQETRKILSLPDLKVNPTCVRVPVFYGHSEAVRLQFEQPVTPAQVRERLVSADGLEVMDDPEKLIFPTPRDNAAGADSVLVGRIRVADPDPSGEGEACENAINMWIVGDNVRKGAALNSVQIAELLIDRLQ